NQNTRSAESAESGKTGSGKSATSEAEPTSDRMVIYNAEIAVTVKNFQEAQEEIQSHVAEADGYIVQSSVSEMEEGNLTGTVKVRIPEPKFRSFLDQRANFDEDVTERSVHGQDVTKQYVDL